MKEVTIRDIFGGGEGHEFLKKALKPLQCIGALPFLAILMLGWVKNVSFFSDSEKLEF